MKDRYNPIICPECGEVAKGTCDMIPGCAVFGEVNEETGEFEYGGETDVFWDGQTTQEDETGKSLLQCHNGHEWPAEFTPGEEES